MLSKQLALVIAVIIVVFVLSAPVVADVQEGLDAYRAGNLEKAFKIFQSYAGEGDPVAEFSLGLMYYRGLFTKQNFKAAKLWFTRSANHGYDRAQVNLGVMYAAGEGGEKDYIEAYKWFSLAASKGNNDGREARDAITQQMTPEQLAVGRKRALEWESQKK